uniref:ribosomal protein S2 n=1 Tax=Meteora sporadica TaxID=2913902 RepID=UPI00300183FC|nr:ribosomal protein S2 [Meteora sporadica]WVH37079.1 ribosomal protein S2 [Meteora sporadica]
MNYYKNLFQNVNININDKDSFSSLSNIFKVAKKTAALNTKKKEQIEKNSTKKSKRKSLKTTKKYFSVISKEYFNYLKKNDLYHHFSNNKSSHITSYTSNRTEFLFEKFLNSKLLGVNSLIENNMHLTMEKTTSHYFDFNPKLASFSLVKKSELFFDVSKTRYLLITALRFIYLVSKNKGCIVFVGNKYPELIKIYASLCDQKYWIQPWYKGTLTNMISTLKKNKVLQEKLLSDTKKVNNKERDWYMSILSFSSDLTQTPDVIISLDNSSLSKEIIEEATKLNIPTVSVLNLEKTTMNPIYTIAGNNWDKKSIEYLLNLFTITIKLGIIGRTEI